MNFVGRNLRLPCGHSSARPPDAVGEYLRTCRTCRGRYSLLVAPSPTLTAKCGKTVLVAKFAEHEKTSAA